MRPWRLQVLQSGYVSVQHHDTVESSLLMWVIDRGQRVHLLHVCKPLRPSHTGAAACMLVTDATSAPRRQSVIHFASVCELILAFICFYPLAEPA